VGSVQKETLDQYIECVVDGRGYGIKISDIQEIIRVQDITEVPGGRSYVKGVINLRGVIVPIVSLRKWFGLRDDVVTKTTRFVILKSGGESAGIIVDKVNKVTTFTAIHPPPDKVGSMGGAYLTGIGQSSTGLIGILNLRDFVLV